MYLPLIAAPVAIQPSVLPVARLYAALPLDGESRTDALPLDDRAVNLHQAARTPGALHEWADLFSQLDNRHAHTLSHSLTLSPSHAHGVCVVK